MNTVFDSIFTTTVTAATISVTDFLICIAVSLLIGLFLAVATSIKAHNTQSFILTMVLLPAVVCVVIMMVNGNIGAGVAVTGAFSLVRFRSAPGSAKDIVTIFLAMGAGLVCGMGYLGYAALFALILGIVMVIYNITAANKTIASQVLRITIPEDLNYTEVFDEVFTEYTTSCELVSTKTTNLGSLYKLRYRVKLKNQSAHKEFLDKLREKNGNLEVGLSMGEAEGYEL